jgi:HlyD family secretion protein
MRHITLGRLFFVAICTATVICVVAYNVYFYVIPRAVMGIVVEAKATGLEIRGPALLDATNKVGVTARIQGFLKSVNVDKNDSVVADQVLAEIDSEDLVSQLAIAQSDAKAAKLAVAEARGNLDSTKALADKATADFDRRRPLIQSGTISQSDWTATEATYKETLADLTRAGITVERLQAQEVSSNYNVQLLEVRLNDATIRSPLNGVVVGRDRNVGDLLSPGVQLMELVDPSTIILAARFDESVMGTIKPGQHANVQFVADRARSFNGTVSRLIKKVDEETREFEVDIILDELPNIWALGQRATVIVNSDAPAPTVTLPQDILVRRRGRIGVWKIEDRRAVWTAVNLGFPSGNSVQIVNGLQLGDVVLWPKDRYEYEPVKLDERSSSATVGLPK